MITIDKLTKRYGDRNVVDQLSFTVQPGQVTGFLGPNGAGKSTTMRSMVGLDRPTSGNATVNGQHYTDMAAPLCVVGTLLDARAAHPRRRAIDHLRALAATHGFPKRRVQEVLEQVGLTDAAKRHVGVFSLGMRQRLGIAVALLGNPGAIILDEPVNGLDPEGIIWIRELLASLASEGRTVFLSSHLMTEMAQVAERVIVIGQGKLIKDTTVDDLARTAEVTSVEVRSLEPDRLQHALTAAGGECTRESDHLTVRRLTTEEIGRIALDQQVVVTELVPHRISLETAVLQLTESHRDHTGLPVTTVREVVA